MQGSAEINKGFVRVTPDRQVCFGLFATVTGVSNLYVWFTRASKVFCGGIRLSTQTNSLSFSNSGLVDKASDSLEMVLHCGSQKIATILEGICTVHQRASRVPIHQDY